MLGRDTIGNESRESGANTQRSHTFLDQSEAAKLPVAAAYK